MSVLRLTSAVIASATLLAGQLTAAGEASGATDDPAGQCAELGRQLRYLVVFDHGTSAEAAEQEVSAACGSTTIYYPAIAVAVATSRDPAFAERIGPDRAYSAQAERATDSRHDDRTEGTPAAARAAVETTTGSPFVADRTDEQWNLRMIGAVGSAADPERSEIPENTEVVVGVLDSGVDAEHPDLRDAIEPELSAGCLRGAPDTARDAWLPTTSSHGTHVAGTIAAAADGRGTTGVAPGTRIASIKVVDDDGHADPEAAVCGLMWAAEQGMTVANSSFSLGTWSPSCRPGEDHEIVREAVARAVEYAEERGTLNVAAATNGGVALTPTTDTPHRDRSGDDGEARSGACEVLPAGLRKVVAVSAVGRDGVKASYSSYGLGVVDLTAPGGDGNDCVLSTVPGGYDSLCGTSMAAPHVTGVAALLAAREPRSPARLRDALVDEAAPMPCPADYDLTGNGSQEAYCSGYSGYNGFYGHGMPDLGQAPHATRPPDSALAR